MESRTPDILELVRIGTAGWTLPRQWREHFPDDGSHLERYAERLRAVEINSSFYRAHRRAVYARWASLVPSDFRFAVKVPRAVTHDQRLVATDVLLEVFLEEVSGLGDRQGPLLVQLPPSLRFGADVVDEFFTTLRLLHAGAVVCEPRNSSWFTTRAAAMLRRHRVARVAADPAVVAQAAEPGGWPELEYYRLHGSPRIYYSEYESERLAPMARDFAAPTGRCRVRWCIFDNTTLGAATGNALELTRMLGETSCPMSSGCTTSP